MNTLNETKCDTCGSTLVECTCENRKPVRVSIDEIWIAGQKVETSEDLVMYIDKGGVHLQASWIRIGGEHRFVDELGERE